MGKHMDMLFISSTFQDMQYERDAIRDFVMPHLNMEAYAYGQSVSVCDLRWGINTADMDAELAALKVLDVCLDEIDRSEPPMIVILGERYGWIPPGNLIGAVAERKDFQLEDFQLSATALEIEYGTLIHRNNVLFYFRELEGVVLEEKYLAEDEERQRKVADLKSKIMRLPNGKVRKYKVRFDKDGICQDDIYRFAKMVYEDIRHILFPKWQSHPEQSPFEKERASHWAYIKEKSDLFLAREAQANSILQSVLDGQGRIVITGEHGSGKSTLFCKVAAMLKEKGLCVIPFVGGLTADSSTSMGILRQLVYCMEEEFGMEHIQDTFAGEKAKMRKLRERLSELCLSFQNRSQSLVIMIDAVDQLLADSDIEKMIFIPERMASNVHVVISCLPGIKLENGENFYLLPIDQADKELAIRCILQRHHKELAESVKEDLMDHPSSGNPLFLNLLLQRLLIMNRLDFGTISQLKNGIERISDYQREIISNVGRSLEEMSISLFKEVGERVNSGLVSKVIEYMALSR